MPQVPGQIPRYNQRQVQDAGLPNARVSQNAPLEAFGGGRAAQGLNSAVSGVAKEVFEFASAQKKKADDTAVQDAYTKTVSMKNDLFYNPEKGAITRGGKEVFGIIDEYGSQYDKNADTIEESLSNQDQKDQYRIIRQRQKSDLDTDLNRHVFSQAKKFEDETFKATVEVTRQDAILHYQDPAKVQDALSLQKATIIDYARKNNLPPEYVKLATDEAVSKTQTDIINRMLANGDDMLASKYFKDNKETISGGDIVALEKNIEEGSLRGNSQRATDAIVARSKDMSEAITKADDITDPKLRDETVRRVKDHYNTQKTVESERRDAIFQEASKIVEQTKSVDSIPPKQYMDLELSQRNALDARAKQLREGVEPTTDLKVYYGLTEMIAADKPAFLKTNLLNYQAKLSPTDFKKFADMQADARKGSTTKMDGFLTDKQAVDVVLAQVGLNPNAEPDSSMGKRVKRMYDMIDARVIKYQQDTGKKADNDVLRKITQELGIEVVVKRDFWFDEKKLLGEATTGDEVVDIVVPDDDAEAISAKLRKAGIPVTDKTVKKWYLQWKGSSGK